MRIHGNSSAHDSGAPECVAYRTRAASGINRGVMLVGVERSKAKKLRKLSRRLRIDKMDFAPPSLTFSMSLLEMPLTTWRHRSYPGWRVRRMR